MVHTLFNVLFYILGDIDQSRSPQSEKSAQKDISSRRSTTSGRKDTKYKLLYVSKRRGGGHAQDSSSTSDGLNNLDSGNGKCVVSTKSCPPTQSTTTQNGGSSPPKQNKNADEFQFRSAQQREVISAEKSNSKGGLSRQQRRNLITLKGFSKKAQNKFPNSNNGAESIL